MTMALLFLCAFFVGQGVISGRLALHYGRTHAMARAYSHVGLLALYVALAMLFMAAYAGWIEWGFHL